jgi:hypothetical protein
VRKEIKFVQTRKFRKKNIERKEESIEPTISKEREMLQLKGGC